MGTWRVAAKVKGESAKWLSGVAATVTGAVMVWSLTNADSPIYLGGSKKPPTPTVTAGLAQQAAGVMQSRGTLAPAITLSQAAAPRGSKVNVKGTGFAPGERIELHVHTIPVGTATADADGAFDVEITVPAGAALPNLPTTVSATGLTSEKTIRTAFRATGS